MSPPPAMPLCRTPRADRPRRLHDPILDLLLVVVLVLGIAIGFAIRAGMDGPGIVDTTVQAGP